MTETDNEKDEEQTTTRRLDGELRIMGAILRLLDEVDDSARDRIVAYLKSRYMVEK